MKLEQIYERSKAVIDQIENEAVSAFRIEQFETTAEPAYLSVVVSYRLDRDMQFTRELNPTQIKTDRIFKELRFAVDNDELLGLFIFKP